MEARQFSFGASTPPAAYKFDPTDVDIVAHYLLPRAAGVPNPHAHDAVIDADPCSCPPWELLRRHGGHDGSDDAFFFGLVPKKTKAGRRLAKRAVSEDEEGGGGTWVLQRSTEESLVILCSGGDGGGGDEIEIGYKKRYLSHRSDEDARTTTGWVMDEYEIVDPPLHGAVLSRVRITVRGKNKFQKHLAAAAKKLAPGAEEPGPSNYLDDDGPVAGSYVVMGTSGGAQAEAVHQGDDNSGGFLGEMAGGYYSALAVRSAGAMVGYFSALYGAGEDGGYYVDDSNSYFSEGITFDYFSNSDGNGDYFLQDDGGNGD